MEKWDLYTKYREKSGKEHIRGRKDSRRLLPFSSTRVDTEPKGGIFDIPAFFSQADIPTYVGMCRGLCIKG